MIFLSLMNSAMKKCFLSHRLVLELPGEFVALQRGWLTPEQVAGVQGEQAYAYLRYAAASDQAGNWMLQQLLHATENLHLEQVVEIEEGFLLRDPQDKAYFWIGLGGLLLRMPTLADMEAGERLPPWRTLHQRVALHVDGLAPALAKAMQSALLQSKSVPLDGMLESLGIQQCFLHPESVAQARLRLNSALRTDWRGDGFAADCDRVLLVPEVALQAIRNAEAGINPMRNLDQLLLQVNVLSAGGDREGLGKALSLLFDHGIYFGAADREVVYRKLRVIQQEIFDQTDYNSDELDAFFEGKTVDASAYSADLED
jgi:hypothetical protein